MMMIMKNCLFLIFSFLSIGLCQSQVGINTKNPQGVFHFDKKGNSGSSTNLEDDIIISSDNASGANVSIGGLPVSGASIAMYSSTKGFLPNRVQLTSSIDVTTVPNPETGMLVYNIAASGVYPNNTLPGYYIFQGSKWLRLRTSAYSGLSETSALKTAVTTKSTNEVNSSTAPIADFGSIQIFDDGAYAFSFNINATSSTGALSGNITRGVLNIYILKKSLGDAGFTPFKGIEINPALFPNGNSFTLSAITSLELKSQDQLMFRISHYGTYPSITLKAGATYLTYWKL